MSTKFSRKIEDFTCEHCGAEVIGNGYTNHCPKCLWSKHVDVYPGDRASDCHGIMEPVGIEMKNGKYRLIHKCIKCGHIQKNRTAEQDNFERILEISQQQNLPRN